MSSSASNQGSVDTSLITREPILARIDFGPAQVAVLSRNCGVSPQPFASLNVTDHTGDDLANVTRNLDIVKSALDLRDIAQMRPEHGRAVIHAKGGGVMPPADGLVTSESDVAVMAVGADCVVCAIADRAGNAVAVFHAGWKGVLADVATATVRELIESGCQESNLVAVIGPYICGACYEVPSDRVNQFENQVPEAVVDARHIDIGAGVAAQLRAHNVSVQYVNICTFENPNVFSYRRDKTTGRGGILAWLTAPEQ